jgi:protein-S-isoprenylcysteine O-methyltransferase Ste14
MVKLVAFLAITALLVYISRAVLFQNQPKTPRSHGFYRFFAWEFIVALFLLNVEAWFRDSFAWHQIIAWFLLSASLFPLGFGVHSLVTRGKPVKQRPGEQRLLGFEKTSTLVTTGVYRYIRHPLYSSLLLLNWGIFFKLPNWVGGLLALAATLFLIATARADEAECLRFFGQAYQEYMRCTRRFFPFLY